MNKKQKFDIEFLKQDIESLKKEIDNAQDLTDTINSVWQDDEKNKFLKKFHNERKNAKQMLDETIMTIQNIVEDKKNY